MKEKENVSHVKPTPKKERNATKTSVEVMQQQSATDLSDKIPRQSGPDPI